jgi:hypothetical protein
MRAAGLFAVFVSPALAFAQEFETREPGEFVCSVGLLNEFVGQVACADFGVTPAREYDVLVMRIGQNYLGRLQCYSMDCGGATSIALSAEGKVPALGDSFECRFLNLADATWQCFPAAAEPGGEVQGL